MASRHSYALPYALLCAGLTIACGSPDAGFEEVEEGAGAALGKADALSGPITVVEIDSDFVELRNDGDAPVELDGWYLSFSRRRVRLEAMTGRVSVVPAGGLAVVAASGSIPLRVPPWVPVVETSRDLADLLSHSRSLILRDPARRVSDRIDAREYADAPVAVERRLKTRMSPSPVGRSPGARNAIRDHAALGVLFADPLTQSSNPLPGELARLIDGAVATVDAALYQLDHPAVIDALMGAAERGVRVRVATDSHYLEDPAYRGGYLAVEAAGGTVIGDQRTARQHNKFVVVDGRAVWVGSYNPVLQERGAFTAADDVVRVTSPELAKVFTAELDEMMGGSFGPSKRGGVGHVGFADGAKIEVYFAPTDAPITAITAQLERATSNIYFSQFAFYSDAASRAMVRRFAAGVDVRGVLDRRSANAASRYTDLIAAGVDVRRPYYEALLHHKFIIVDYGTTDPVVITGSYNLSGKAETQNDESVVIIHDPHVVAAYYRVWSRLYDATHGDNTDTTAAAAVAITEVLAGPSGFVELASYGDVPAVLDGLVLADRDGTEIPLTGTLTTGTRLVVDVGAAGIEHSDALVIRDGRRRLVARFDSPGYHGAGLSLERGSVAVSDDDAVWVPSAAPGGTPGW